MKKAVAIALVSIGALSACGSITAPVIGETSTGERFTGTATASIDAGTFDIASASGVKCSGVYDQFSKDRSLILPFRCSDGLTGTATLLRDPGLRSGAGVVTFSDGTTGTFQFGVKRLGKDG